MRFRTIALRALAAAAIVVPVFVGAVPASAIGYNYWISEDPGNQQFDGCSIVSQGHNLPYIAGFSTDSCSGSGIAFILVGCVNVNGASWCRMEDTNGLCMNEVDNYFGNPNEQAVLADSCVAGDSAEEWHAFGVGNDKNALENRHTGHYINIETQCQSLNDCSKRGTIHTTSYRWAWSTPGA